jgi:hypothetical protein
LQEPVRADFGRLSKTSGHSIYRFAHWTLATAGLTSFTISVWPFEQNAHFQMGLLQYLEAAQAALMLPIFPPSLAYEKIISLAVLIINRK